MSKPMTGVSFPVELMQMLRKMGAPEHITSFKLECKGPQEFVTFECTAYAHDQLEGFGALPEVISKKYVLAERES